VNVTIDVATSQQQRSRVIAATCAGFNLRRASRAISHYFDRALTPSGLRSTQFTLLAALAISGSPTIGELSVALVIDRTTLSRNLKLVRSANLVEAIPTGDRREHRYGLTDQGRAALETALPLWEAAQAQVVEPLGQDRWQGMLGDLHRLLGIVRGHTGDLVAPNGTA